MPPVLLCVPLSLLIPALLPITDEFRMNFWGLSVFCLTYLVFSAAFTASWELTSQRMHVRRASNLLYHITNPAASLPHRTGTMQNFGEGAQGELFGIHLPRASEM